MPRLKEKGCTCGVFGDRKNKTRIPDPKCPVHVHRIWITLEGGLIQDIEGIPDGTEIVKMDFDVEGADPDEITSWTTTDEKGKVHTHEAFIGIWTSRDGGRQKADTQESLNKEMKDLIRQLPK